MKSPLAYIGFYPGAADQSQRLQHLAWPVGQRCFSACR